MLRTSSLRVLRGDDLPAVTALLDRDPVSNVFVSARIEALGLDQSRLGAQMWGHVVDGRVMAVCHAGANLIPAAADGDAVRAFADRAKRQGRRCASIVGPRAAVDALWERLEPAWGPARDVRERQPLLAASAPSRVPADPGVRRVRPDEIDILLPACIAMFTEEVGVSPVGSDGGTAYRSRVGELIAAGRSFARIDDGRVIFKAEIGSATSRACQVQGVWVDPELRGQGLSVGGMAAVVDMALQDVAPTVSLYVNDFNAAALAAYRHVGFEDRGTFMSVLF